MTSQPNQARPVRPARAGYGDVGAPLVWSFEKLHYLIGLVATGAPNAANLNGVTGFLAIGPHTPWIRSIVTNV